MTIAALLVAAGGACAQAPEDADGREREALRLSVERVCYGGQPDVVAADLRAAAFVADFYERRSFIPAWRDDARIAALVTAIRKAFADGLTPEDYHLAGIEAAEQRAAGMSPAERDPSSIDWDATSGRDFRYSLTQRPGAENALGRVKFIFRNAHSVYLHDTPARQLFNMAERAFSHGCIRVENPLDLAEILLRPNGWDRERIDAAVASGRTTTVYLARPVPILLMYLTANVDPGGLVYFYRDIYERDERIATALDAPYRIN